MISVGVEVEIASCKPELVLDLLEKVMPVVHERIVVRPYLMDDFHPGIMTIGVDDDEAPTGSECSRERGEHALGLELERSAGPIRL